MMQESDIENVVVMDGNDSEIKWVGNAMKRQNRYFGSALILFLLVSVGYVGVQTFAPSEEISIDLFDNQAGTITNDAKNAKAQQYKDMIAAAHRGQNGTISWFNKHDHSFSQRGGDEQGGKLQNYLSSLDRAQAKQKAILDRWQRTHPDQDLPDRYKQFANDPDYVKNHYATAFEKYNKEHGGDEGTFGSSTNKGHRPGQHMDKKDIKEWLKNSRAHHDDTSNTMSTRDSNRVPPANKRPSPPKKPVPSKKDEKEETKADEEVQEEKKEAPAAPKKPIAPPKTVEKEESSEDEEVQEEAKDEAGA